MKVLIYASGQDTGGQGGRLVRAFRRHAPEIELRSMAKTSSYMNWPADLPMRKSKMDDLYQQADLVHVRNGFEEYDRLAAKYGPKPVVIHFHGTRYRANPRYWVAEAKKRNARILVSTLDLWMLAPDDSEWLPSIQHLDAYL